MKLLNAQRLASDEYQNVRREVASRAGRLTVAEALARLSAHGIAGVESVSLDRLPDHEQAVVNGTFSAEMMLDTVWTLCHNNGPIFNKGLMYSMYSDQLVRILDVQRSGQVPELIAHDAKVQLFVTPAMKTFFQTAMSKFAPGTFRPYVDWEVVKLLGAVHSYPAELAEQQSKHGMSPAAKEAKKIAEAKKKADAIKAAEAAKKAAEAHAEFLKSNWEMMPGTYVKKIEIKREAA